MPGIVYGLTPEFLAAASVATANRFFFVNESNFFNGLLAGFVCILGRMNEDLGSPNMVNSAGGGTPLVDNLSIACAAPRLMDTNVFGRRVLGLGGRPGFFL